MAKTTKSRMGRPALPPGEAKIHSINYSCSLSHIKRIANHIGNVRGPWSAFIREAVEEKLDREEKGD